MKDRLMILQFIVVALLLALSLRGRLGDTVLSYNMLWVFSVVISNSNTRLIDTVSLEHRLVFSRIFSSLPPVQCARLHPGNNT